MVITSIHHCSYNNTQETTVQFDEYPIQTTVTKDPNHVTAWISQTENVNRLHLHHLVVGLDVEWRPCYLRGSQNPVAVLQLCVNRRCLVYQIIHSPYIPSSLVNFLSNPSYTFTGIGIDDDVEKLYRHYGVGRAASVADLRALAAEVYEGVNESGLKGLTRLVLGKEVEKPSRIRLSNWDDECLSQEQVEYACVDAFLSFRIGLVLISMAGRGGYY